MHPFYLTPTALSDFSLLIFIGFVIAYLGLLLRRARQHGEKAVTMGFLLGAFAGMAGAILCIFLEETLYPHAGQLVLPLQTVFLTAGLVCLLQFAYRFPAAFPAEKREMRVAFWLSLLYPLGELGFAIYRYVMLAQGAIRYRPGWTLIFFIVWIAWVALRKVALADLRPAPYWRKFWQPREALARRARNTALIGLLLLLIMGISLLRDNAPFSEYVAFALISVGILATVLIFILYYLQALPEQTSFIVKLAAVSLASLMALTGAMGYLLTQPFTQSYHNPNSDLTGKTLRFSPNARGGYTTNWVAYRFEPAWDESLPEEYNHAAIGFAFPFFGKNWSEFYVMRNSVVSFGREAFLLDSLFQYGRVPAIFLLGLDLDPPAANEVGGLYIHRAPQKTTVTWLNLPESRTETHRNTLQLTLYPDGVFETSFVALDDPVPFDMRVPWHSYRLLGALPGNGNTRLAYFQLAQDLPYAGNADGAAAAFHLEFRRTLHTFLLPYFYVILLSTAVLLLTIPFYFRAVLVRPLDNLLVGLRKVDAGQLDVTIPVLARDEFGYVTESFNKMTGELRALVRDLDGRVAERTIALADARAYLDNILRSATDYAIITTDRELRITFFNHRAEAMYGIREADALGQPIAHICAQERDAARFEAGLRRVENHGAHEYVMALAGPNGLRQIASRIAGIYDSAGHLLGYARFSRDVTERMITEARLLSQQRSIAVLEERAQIGRDLHDHLGQIFGFLSLQSQTAAALLAAGKEEAGLLALEQLGEVAQEGHNQVREFILGMRSSLAAAPQDFWGNLQAYAVRLRQLYQMEVTLDLPPQPGLLLPPDKELHLLRIIQESLTNVRRHSGVEQARISFRQEGARMRVTIADAGQGFDARAFLPDTARPLSDLGQPAGPSTADAGHFGLAGMAERAAALGGDLQIRSRPGEGTAIEISFPVGREGIGELAGPLKDLRVLLVDDQPIFLEGLHNLLTAYGLHVVGMAHDGLEAQALARSARPDVIVMDIHMPVCDGIEATRRIKQAMPETEIVMLSVSAEDETLFEALKAGASGYLLKSMRAAEFFLLISGLAEGIPPLAPELAAKVLAEFQGRLQTEATLSDEQSRILRRVAQGRTYLQIGLELSLSERTVKRYMKEIMDVLHVGSRAEAEAYARQRGLGVC
ncbi:MAG: response regulator [Anaerolineae bacterium]